MHKFNVIQYRSTPTANLPPEVLAKNCSLEEAIKVFDKYKHRMEEYTGKLTDIKVELDTLVLE